MKQFCFDFGMYIVPFFVLLLLGVMIGECECVYVCVFFRFAGNRCMLHCDDVIWRLGHDIRLLSRSFKYQ